MALWSIGLPLPRKLPVTLMYAVAACLLTGLPAVAPCAAAEDAAGSLAGCLKAVASAEGEEISCDYMALLTEAERADMQRLSRGLLQDARCKVEVRIARKLVEPALTEPDHVFEAPPQPVTCEIKTKDGGFPVTATFAPKVTFKAGLAVDGSPGLAGVTGVNRYLAWPIVQYVNRAAGIRKSMLDMINLYRAALRATSRGPM